MVINQTKDQEALLGPGGMDVSCRQATYISLWITFHQFVSTNMLRVGTEDIFACQKWFEFHFSWLSFRFLLLYMSAYCHIVMSHCYTRTKLLLFYSDKSKCI